MAAVKGKLSFLDSLLRIFLGTSKLDVCILDHEYGSGSISWYRLMKDRDT